MSALITAWILNGEGGGKEVPLSDLSNGFGDQTLWVHLDRVHKDAEGIIDRIVSLDENIKDSLFADNTRPRCDKFEDGYLINLRGVNTNTGNDPHDMIAARIWVGTNIIISLRKLPMMAFDDLRKNLALSKGPKDQGEFIAEVANSLTERMSPILEKIDSLITAYEEMDYLDSSVEQDLIEQRQHIARLNRFITPQQQALLKLSNLNAAWMEDDHKMTVRQALDSVMLYLDELKELKERTEILNDTIKQQSSNRIEHTMYILSVVAGIFLPLGFLTGLLGINVGGMPGVEDKNAFWVVLLLIAGVGIGEYLYFKWKRWI